MKTKTRNITILAFILFLAAVLFISIISRPPVELESGIHLTMGTFARIVVVAEDMETAEKCIGEALAAIDNVDNLMSDYKDDSEITTVNTFAAEREVKVSEDTYEVVKRSIKFSKLTDGAFDITVGPLMDLFNRAKETGVATTQEEIDIAKTMVGYEKLTLNDEERTIRFGVEGMRLDLGGIAKGYGIDKALESLKENGAIGGMVDIGGDIRCFGRASKGKKNWLVGVQDPTSTELIMALKVSDAAVATSGDYQQFVIIDGKQYGHIIDRTIGTSAESGLSSVTIITDNATDADALATAVSVMGAEDGLALIESLPDIEAIVISSRPEFSITKTSGAGQYINN